MLQQLHGFGGDLLTILAIVWAIFVTVFWMLVAWRAMKAHERIAQGLSRGAQGVPRSARKVPDALRRRSTSAP